MRRDGGGSDPKFYFLSSVDLKEEKMYIGKSLEINKHPWKKHVFRQTFRYTKLIRLK